MIRGTTPTLQFICDIDWDNVEQLSISFQQSDKTIIKLSQDDCTYADGVITVLLTQEQTLSFNYKNSVSIQIKVKFTDDTVVASNIILTTVAKILDEDVM